MSNLNIFKNALAERKAEQTTITTPSGYHSLLNAIRHEVKIVNGGPGSGRRDGFSYHSEYGSGSVPHESESDALSYHQKKYPNASFGDWENNGGNSERKLVWENNKDSENDDGKKAVAQIVRKSANVSNSTYTNPDGSFKIVNGSQIGAATALFMEKGHSEESATRMAKSLLNAETDNVCLPGTANGLATASSKAADASEAAERTGTASDHFAAKNAHEVAGNHAARLGCTEKASHHAKKASEHQAKGVAAYPKGQTDKQNAGSPKA
jgi:hypothetical protein